jgi:hypothetical protein
MEAMIPEKLKDLKRQMEGGEEDFGEKCNQWKKQFTQVENSVSASLDKKKLENLKN